MPSNSLNRVVDHLRNLAFREHASSFSDAQLLDSFLERGERAALDMIVRRHAPMILGVCRRMLGHEQDAEDAFQATFLVLVRKAASIKPRGMVGNWLYGVACQTAIRARALSAKRRAKERRLSKIAPPQLEREVLSSELASMLDEELRGLPDKYRSAIVLCDLEGKSYKEAAHLLACPEGTLSARLTRGRLILAKRLKRHGKVVTGTVVGTLFSQQAAAASLPVALLSSTLKAVHSLPAGTALGHGLVSAHATLLTEGALKTMFLTKIKLITGLLMVASLGGASTVLIDANNSVTGPTITAQEVRKPEVAGSPPKTSQAATHIVKVPSLFDGVVLFIGSELKAGEKLPPERIITVQIDGEAKRFRRLKKGDTVTEGDLLGQLDDRVTRGEMAIKKARLLASKADEDGASVMAMEAQTKYETSKSLLSRKAISGEEYRTALLTRDKFKSDYVIKTQSTKLAELELKQAQTLVDMHQFRSQVNGVIHAIRAYPGEAVRKYETVLEIDVKDE